MDELRSGRAWEVSDERGEIYLMIEYDRAITRDEHESIEAISAALGRPVPSGLLTGYLKLRTAGTRMMYLLAPNGAVWSCVFGLDRVTHKGFYAMNEHGEPRDPRKAPPHDRVKRALSDGLTELFGLLPVRQSQN